MELRFACASLALIAVAATAADFPAVKAGLWESRVAHSGGASGGQGRVTTMCLDAQVQKEMMEMGMGMMQSMCTRKDMRVDGNKIIGSSECKMGETTMRSNSVTTFNGNAGYH